eukprot:Clim_evm4s200 gene=Clim_evmTU4s200
MAQANIQISVPPAHNHLAPQHSNVFVCRATVGLWEFYKSCNPQIHYGGSAKLRKYLTQPGKPANDNQYDNEEANLIVSVNDCLTPDGTSFPKYRVAALLGQGTFGQVVRCRVQDREDEAHQPKDVAVKVIKNKPAYYNQSLTEVKILQELSQIYDPENQHHLVRLLNHFIHREHLCLVFELLDMNLFELLKQNDFKGVSVNLIKYFMTQMLDALIVMKKAGIIHCDLKPENVLLTGLGSPSIKVVDFGSACYEGHTVYSYIQSRFYRSPEVIIGVPYSSAIDIWSLGCIAAELYLGLPIFPGSSEYDQLYRILEVTGPLPDHMLSQGMQTPKYYHISQGYSCPVYTLKSADEYYQESREQQRVWKRYFEIHQLWDIESPKIRPYENEEDIDKQVEDRQVFADFLSQMLVLDSHQRWTPNQLIGHPFITGQSMAPRQQQQQETHTTAMDTSMNAQQQPHQQLPVQYPNTAYHQHQNPQQPQHATYHTDQPPPQQQQHAGYAIQAGHGHHQEPGYAYGSQPHGYTNLHAVAGNGQPQPQQQPQQQQPPQQMEYYPPQAQTQTAPPATHTAAPPNISFVPMPPQHWYPAQYENGKSGEFHQQQTVNYPYERPPPPMHVPQDSSQPQQQQHVPRHPEDYYQPSYSTAPQNQYSQAVFGPGQIAPPSQQHVMQMNTGAPMHPDYTAQQHVQQQSQPQPQPQSQSQPQPQPQSRQASQQPPPPQQYMAPTYQ